MLTLETRYKINKLWQKVTSGSDLKDPSGTKLHESHPVYMFYPSWDGILLQTFSKTMPVYTQYVWTGSYWGHPVVKQVPQIFLIKCVGLDANLSGLNCLLQQWDYFSHS